VDIQGFQDRIIAHFLWIAITFNVIISILFGFGLDLVLLLKYSNWRVYLFKLKKMLYDFFFYFFSTTSL